VCRDDARCGQIASPTGQLREIGIEAQQHCWECETVYRDDFWFSRRIDFSEAGQVTSENAINRPTQRNDEPFSISGLHFPPEYHPSATCSFSFAIAAINLPYRLKQFRGPSVLDSWAVD
jgi:hypothetical protein